MVPTAVCCCLLVLLNVGAILGWDVIAGGVRRWRHTTFVRSPSVISTVTDDFMLLTIQFPSHRGSSLLAVGTDNHTKSQA